MKSNNAIRDKSYAFALNIIELYKVLAEDKREWVMSRQILRSGTSVGAMVKESEHAESLADFIHKFSIALKEANESEYWLNLLKDSGFIDSKLFDSLAADCSELIKILVSIIKTSKNKLKDK